MGASQGPPTTQTWITTTIPNPNPKPPSLLLQKINLALQIFSFARPQRLTVLKVLLQSDFFKNQVQIRGL